ncbi:VOC family protein [Gordonia jinhuaensis]|uniref:VOC domain-containing protein n=1 Tax=Gordonia jinhuaensis TaxID=1517702 RepID=A0A916TI29_9ACTN|nr:VOC family protein [Gordonia jinhuaensis]GGB44079.1 hypothetical protein GCM10011489_34540 [Gordonia jinhuaensis]
MTEYSAPIGAPIWFDLMTSDADAAVSFYQQLFGWEAEDPNPDLGGYRNFTLNGKRIAGLMSAADDSAPSVWSSYLHTADPDETLELVKAAGGTVMVPPMDVGDEGTMAVAIDAAGAVIGFWKPNKHKGFADWGVPGAPYWFECASQDYPRSLVFYPEVVGARVETIIDNSAAEVVEPGNPLRYAQVFFGDMAYAGIMDATNIFPPAMPSFWQIYVTVEEVAATVETAEKLGGTVMMGATDTPYGTLATLQDPNGAMISLGSPPAGR